MNVWKTRRDDGRIDLWTEEPTAITRNATADCTLFMLTCSRLPVAVPIGSLSDEEYVHWVRGLAQQGIDMQLVWSHGSLNRPERN